MCLTPEQAAAQGNIPGADVTERTDFRQKRDAVHVATSVPASNINT